MDTFGTINQIIVEVTQPQVQSPSPRTDTPHYAMPNHNGISTQVKVIDPLTLSNTSISSVLKPPKVKLGAHLPVLASCIESIPEQDHSRHIQSSKTNVPHPGQNVHVAWTNGPEIKFAKVASPKYRKQESIKILEDNNVKEMPKLIGRSCVTCSVCEEKIKYSNITTIEGCCHVLHIECVLPYLQLKISEGCVNIPCPFSQCNCMMSQRFLRSILSEEEMARYYRFASYSFIQRNKNGDGKWEFCQEPNCNELFRIVKQPRKGKYAVPPLLECKTTRKRRCALCMGPYHPQFDTCEQYRNSKDPAYNDARLLEVVAKNNWKQCPKCKLYVEKNQGCNHIHCRCGKHFCYVCLGPYPNCNCPGAGQHMNFIPPQQME